MSIINGIIAVATVLTGAAFIGVFFLTIAAGGVHYGPLGVLGVLLAYACVMAFFIGAFS